MTVDQNYHKLADASAACYEVLKGGRNRRLLILHYTPNNSYYLLDQQTWLSDNPPHEARNANIVFYGSFFELTQLALGIPLDIEQAITPINHTEV